MSRDVVVIGAGLSGLSVAQKLVEQGHDVTVLERRVHIGGNAVSERFEGYLMERGPTAINATVPSAMAHLEGLGLLKSALDLGPNVKKRYLRDRGKLTGITTSPTGFLTSGYLSPAARLRVITELFRPRKKTDEEETIHAFVSRRFGREFADKVIAPMAAGIFMGDSKRLSVNGTFPKLCEMESQHGSITRAILKAKKGSAPDRRMLSWKNGIATLPAALAQPIVGQIKTGICVTKISQTPSGFIVETATSGTIHTRAVVLAVQPHVAAALLEDLDAEAAGAAADIKSPPLSVLFFGYRREQVSHPLDGLGYLGTHDNNIISGAQFCSTMFAGRAPQGHVSISCYVGGDRNSGALTLSEPELLGAAHAELAALLGIKGRPCIQRAHHYALGLPQYELGHEGRKNTLQSLRQRLPGMFLTGNYLEGISAANCMALGFEKAGQVNLFLASKNPGNRNAGKINQSS